LMPIDAADVFTENIEQLSADQRLGVSHYTVRRGDSVASIARKFHATVNVIRELNDMPSGALTVGNDLRVPSAVTELPEKVMLAAARVDGHGRSARRPHVQIVRRGDSLWTIARHNGMNVNTLARLNGMNPWDFSPVSAPSSSGSRPIARSPGVLPRRCTARAPSSHSPTSTTR